MLSAIAPLVCATTIPISCVGSQNTSRLTIPWTKRQVRYLLLSGSPLSEDEKAKMKRELHANPALGHARKKGKGKKRTKTMEEVFYG